MSWEEEFISANEWPTKEMMMKNKRTGWVCPECEGRVLASTRPRKNSVKRFCLPCSSKTGFLVERRAPALEKKRRASKARKEGRAQREKEKLLAKDTINGVSVREEWREALRLKSVRKYNKSLGDNIYSRSGGVRSSLFSLVVRRSKTNRTWVSGTAWWSCGRVVLTVGVDCDRASIVGTLLHELAHLLTPGAHHGYEFWSKLADLVEERFGEEARLLPTEGSKARKQRVVEDRIRRSINEETK